MHREVRLDRAVALPLHHPSPIIRAHTCTTLHTPRTAHHITTATLPCPAPTRTTLATQRQSSPYTINTNSLARSAVNQHHTPNSKQKHFTSTYHTLQHQSLTFNRFLARKRRFNCLCENLTCCLATGARRRGQSRRPRAHPKLPGAPSSSAICGSTPKIISTRPSPHSTTPAGVSSQLQPARPSTLLTLCRISIDASGCSKADSSSQLLIMPKAATRKGATTRTRRAKKGKSASDTFSPTRQIDWDWI